MCRTEEEIKNHIVLPYLQSLGFDPTEIQFERTLELNLGIGWSRLDTGKQAFYKSGRYDALVTRRGQNLFIIEVKAPDVELTDDDRYQATSYAKLLHPVAPFSLVTNGKKWILYDSLTQQEILPGSFKVKDQYRSGSAGQLSS